MFVNALIRYNNTGNNGSGNGGSNNNRCTLNNTPKGNECVREIVQYLSDSYGVTRTQRDTCLHLQLKTERTFSGANEFRLVCVVSERCYRSVVRALYVIFGVSKVRRNWFGGTTRTPERKNIVSEYICLSRSFANANKCIERMLSHQPSGLHWKIVSSIIFRIFSILQLHSKRPFLFMIHDAITSKT